jgi:hypothetical protein
MAKKKSTSPEGGKRGCLGADGTYSIENCKGETQNQGIGSTTGQRVSNVTNTNTERVLIRTSN